MPEYILLFRKLPTDRSRGYADDPVKKSKEEYTRARWQIDAHAFWRSSGDRPFTREELEKIPTSKLQAVYRKFSRESVYSYDEHIKLAESLDKDGRLPSTFMVVAPGSWDMTRLGRHQPHEDAQHDPEPAAAESSRLPPAKSTSYSG